MFVTVCKTFTILLLVSIAILGQNSSSDSNHLSFRNTLHNISYSAKDALLDPITIGTFALAAGVYFTNSDSRITNWALRNHPIYGSVENARTASNVFQNSSLFLFLATYLMKNWYLDSHPISEPLYELTADASAIFLTAISTEIIKKTSNRQRPDGTDFRSFPSGHTSFASTNMTLASDDISDMKLSKGTSILIKSGLFLVVAGTAWGRVEGNKHYTSDVLTGAAIGYFFGQLTDNFLKATKLKNTRISLGMNPLAYDLQLTLGF